MTVLEIINNLIKKRKEENRIPYCAMLRDVMALSGLTKEELQEEIDKLKAEGKIAIKETINSQSFYLR